MQREQQNARTKPGHCLGTKSDVAQVRNRKHRYPDGTSEPNHRIPPLRNGRGT